MKLTERPKLPAKRRFAVKAEQLRQASRIHGGMLGYWGATLGVRFSRVPIPSRRLRSAVFRHVYGKKYAALDETELDRPLADYPSFNALFTRGLRPGARQVSVDPSHVISPCDGTVQEIGRVERDTVVTAKGIRYSVRDLLADDEPHPFAGGLFCVIFLSPADCHRVFCPYGSQIGSVAHVPGFRLLVHPPYQRAEYPVYSLNERVVFRLDTPVGANALVMVAGWGVGNVTLPFDGVESERLGRRRCFGKPGRLKGFRLRRRRTVVSRRAYDDATTIGKGDWLATFELGSTVVLFIENARNPQPLVTEGDPIRYGAPLFGVTVEGAAENDASKSGDRFHV